jgi:hypothetical protein
VKAQVQRRCGERHQIPEIGNLNFERAPGFPFAREFARSNSDFPRFVSIGVHSWFEKYIFWKNEPKPKR